MILPRGSKRALRFFFFVSLFAVPALSQPASDHAASDTSGNLQDEPAVATAAASSLPSRAPGGAVAVRVTLQNTELTEAEVLQALANEFRAPVVKSNGEQGLLLVVDGQSLNARYLDAEGQVVERKVELPRDKSRKLDTIALLSGNLARDEAGELLAELRAEQDDEATLPEATLPESPGVPEPPPLPESDAEEAAKKPEEKTAPKKEAPPPEEARAKNPESQDLTRPWLPVAEVSAALWGDVTYPANLDQKKTHLHVGLVQSDIGSLKGFGANLLILRNLARDRDYAGEGVQMAIVWAESQGFFRGFHAAAIAATGKGGIEGVQAAGVFTFQKNETLGAQLAGVGSLSMSDIEGGQGAGTFAGTWGNIDGVQAAGALSITTGDLTGAQLSGAASITGGKLEGFQLGMLNFAGEVDGFQLSMANIAHKKMDGFQLALGNYAGDIQGTQIGLLNIGGKVNGAQIGLVNVAKDVDGVAFAPVNIIPGIRNQIVAYGSWAPGTATEGAPAGPLTHLGFKFMPDPFYTQLSFGIGPEAEECPSGLFPGDAGCSGNRVLYAPGFAVGARGKLIAGLFTEVDVQYQFEKAFSSSLAHRHAVLGRAALGYDFNKKFGIFAGGGPRMDVQADAEGRYEPLVKFSPHVFAGIQVF